MNNPLKTNVLRGAAVIVASKPLEPKDSVSGLSGGRKRVLPAMIKAGQVTFLERVIIRLQTLGVAPIVVITGFENEPLERNLSKMGVVCLNIENWKDSSLFADAMEGILYVSRTCDACKKILLATPLIPAVSTETLTQLLSSKSPLSVPVFEGIEGLPIVFDKAVVSEFEKIKGDGTLSDFTRIAPEYVERIEVPDQGILSALSVTEDFDDDLGAQGTALHLPMRARIKLGLARETVFFGPGPATLLRLIDETGSVRTACVRMKLSYSKGWQILNLLEEQLGQQVIERRTGGQEGGSSRLTDAGRDLLYRYESLASEAQSSVNALFDRIFSDFLS